MNKSMENLLAQLSDKIDGKYGDDFLQTWDKNDFALHATLILVQLLKQFYQHNISPKTFDSGMAIGIFKDQSTRTRYSFNSAADLVGLDPVELDLGKSQVAHGETTLETANMISFLTRVIGIRDDIYLGIGHTYMLEMAQAVEKGFQEQALFQRPSIINLQSDTDHPTQSLADVAHLVEYFGGIEQLQGKKITMSWAYSPSYGKPLSVPQGIIGLMSRFGMQVTLAYPKGYNLIPAIEQQAQNYANASGGSFSLTHSMAEAFEDADVVYPKSWASYSIMEQRTQLLKEGNQKAYEELERAALAENAAHTDWECTEELMKKTKQGQALYLHCLPADISGVSRVKGMICSHGEVEDSVFTRYRAQLYREASYKPLVIAAMMLLTHYKNPVSVIEKILQKKQAIAM